jgi:hypothetical protein
MQSFQRRLIIKDRNSEEGIERKGINQSMNQIGAVKGGFKARTFYKERRRGEDSIWQ